jgi:tetratricopeptide (TPR) repeat protein
MDAMANEIIRDVEEGVEAYDFLLERQEMDSATKRLSEAFLIGEYMPPVRTLSRDKKRQSLAYAQKANQLVNAIGVKDYTLAETRVHEMETMAKDFDSSKPMAAIETARTVSSMHIAKGVNAAVAGDQKVVEQEFRAATEIWPRNPDLKEAFTKISGYSNVANQAAVAFDQLLSQKNYRQIFDDKARFIAATATDPVRQKQLEQVLDNMTEIEKAIVSAQEIEKRGDFAGAWENTESAFNKFPSDSKLNQIRADLTTKAADFVGALRRAQELKKKGQPGSSLAWYLKAQQIYPNSDIAKQGIESLTEEILPDAT